MATLIVYVIFFLVPSAAARPRDGMRLDARPLDPHEHLGRRADDRDPAHADEKHVGRRVDVAECAKHRERIDGHFRFEPLRQHDLIDIASRDVGLGLLDLRLELLARVI